MTDDKIVFPHAGGNSRLVEVLERATVRGDSASRSRFARTHGPGALTKGLALSADPAAGYVLRCPGRDSYGHVLTQARVHTSGCCHEFDMLPGDEQENTGLRGPKNELAAEILANLEARAAESSSPSPTAAQIAAWTVPELGLRLGIAHAEGGNWRLIEDEVLARAARHPDNDSNDALFLRNTARRIKAKRAGGLT